MFKKNMQQHFNIIIIIFEMTNKSSYSSLYQKYANFRLINNFAHNLGDVHLLCPFQKTRLYTIPACRFCGIGKDMRYVTGDSVLTIM